MTGARAERAQELIRQGFDALGEGRPRDAADLCRRAIALDPASPGAHFLVGLVATDLFRLAPWTYADTVFSRHWDNAISTVKANRYGFTEMMDSEDMMRRIFAEFRERKVIP